jgi:hypothetical protein
MEKELANSISGDIVSYNTISESAEMFLNRKKNFLTGARQGVLPVALVFLVCAGFSALVHAATRSVEGLEFDSVVVWGSVEVEITQGEKMHLRVRGSSADMDMEPFFVSDNVLYLGRSADGHRLDSHLKFKLMAVDLREIALKGSGEIFVKHLQAESLRISVEGSGDLYMHGVTGEVLEMVVAGSGSIQLAEAEASEIEVEVSGSGTVDLGAIKADRLVASLNGSGDVLVAKEGKVNELEVNVVGSGDVEFAKLSASEVDVNIMGSGDAEVWARSVLSVSIMGSGDVAYRGDPELSTTVLGSGDIERLD